MAAGLPDRPAGQGSRGAGSECQQGAGDTWLEVPRDTCMKAGTAAGWDLEKNVKQDLETWAQD